MTISVLTLNKGRSKHLKNLIQGLSRNQNFKGELIIAQMDETYPQDEKTHFPIHHIAMPSQNLPLSKARNKTAALAIYENLIFLDVDCIPSYNFTEQLEQKLQQYGGIISPQIFYLPPKTLPQPWQEKDLKKLGQTHSARYFPDKGVSLEKNPGLFWSISFALSKKTFETIGGFCEDYVGYGAEDTDFGYKAAEKNIKHFLTNDTKAYHQYHQTFDPPWQNFKDIIKNAKVFYQKWQFWPMSGWLKTFAQNGFIEWREQDIIILKEPQPPFNNTVTEM